MSKYIVSANVEFVIYANNESEARQKAFGELASGLDLEYYRVLGAQEYDDDE